MAADLADMRAPSDRDAIAACEDAGIDRVLLELPDATRDETLKLLDDYAPLAA